MALPEYGFSINAPLEPADLTPEVMEMFGRHVQQSEKNMLRDVFREHIKIETPFPVSSSVEEDIFASIFEDV
jgi:hypothetical protein